MISGAIFQYSGQKMNISAVNSIQTAYVQAGASTSHVYQNQEEIKNPQNADQNNDRVSANPSENTETESGSAYDQSQELSQAELQLVQQLKQTDTKVRQHEMAHIAAGGSLILSGANFTYKKGPDGRNYAVGGEVSIDTSTVPGDPEATIQKMRQVRNAALAPANPSSQDIKVASQATQAVSKALSELMVLQAKERAERNENLAFGTYQKNQASDSYQKVSRLPEGESSTFQISV